MMYVVIRLKLCFLVSVNITTGPRTIKTDVLSTTTTEPTQITGVPLFTSTPQSNISTAIEVTIATHITNEAIDSRNRSYGMEIIVLFSVFMY